MYSNGVSEEIIGKAINKYNIPRQNLNVLTKCFAVVSEHENVFMGNFTEDVAQSKDYVNKFGEFAYPNSCEGRADVRLTVTKVSQDRLSSLRSTHLLSAWTRTISTFFRSTASTHPFLLKRPWKLCMT